MKLWYNAPDVMISHLQEATAFCNILTLKRRHQELVGQDTKQVYHNVYLKDFILAGEKRTNSILKAWIAFNKGIAVRSNVHVMGYGDRKSSDIINFVWDHGRLYLESKHSIYWITGKERAKRVKSISVVVPNENKALSSNKRYDMNRLSEYVAQGLKTRAYAIRKDGGFIITSNIIRVDTFRRRIITESGSVYSWIW